jgi:hypothetical protein
MRIILRGLRPIMLPICATAMACVAATAAHGAENEVCIANLTSKGNFLAGRQHSTWQEFPAISNAEAFKRVTAAVVKEGWKIAMANQDLGIISAATEVSFGGGKAAPLNVIVETKEAGSKVTITFATSGGVTASKQAIQKSLCGMLTAVEG